MRLFTWFVRIEDDYATDLAVSLRGGPVFDLLGADGRLMPGVPLRVFQSEPNRLAMPSQPSDVVFAQLGLLVDTPDVADRLFQVGCPVIVDVQFPLADPDQILAIQKVKPKGRRNVALDEAAREHWREPARLARAYEILQLADAVTVGPNGGFAQVHVSTPVMFLPNVDSREAAKEFYHSFAGLVWHLTSRAQGWRRRWQRFWLRRVVVPGYAGMVAARVVIPDELS